MNVTAIGRAVTVPAGCQEKTGPSAPSGPSLLPAPETQGSLDDLSEIYALLSKSRQLGLQQSIKDLRSTDAARKAERRRALAALERAARKRRKGGWLKRVARKALKVAKVAAVVASVALAVGTAGAATPVAVLAIAGATMSAAAFAQSEWHVLERMGVSERWANRVKTGLVLGGAACSLAAGGGALLTESESSATTLALVGRKVSIGASAVAGLSTVGAGVATVEAGRADADAARADAEVVAARAEEAALDRMLLGILADIEASEQADERVLGHLRSSMEARDQTLTLCSMKG